MQKTKDKVKEYFGLFMLQLNRRRPRPVHNSQSVSSQTASCI